MPKWSRYAASSTSSVSSCCSARVPPWVWMSTRPLRWRQAGRRARGRPRSSPRACLPCPAEPPRPAQVHAARPAHRCASPHRGGLAHAGCPPARSRSRRYRRCARPAAIPPCHRHRSDARPRGPRSPRRPSPGVPPLRRDGTGRRPPSDYQHLASVSDGRRHIAADPAQHGPVERDRRAEGRELGAVHHDHPRPFDARCIGHAVHRADPALGIPQAALDVLQLAAREDTHAYATQRTGLLPTSSSGRSRSHPSTAATCRSRRIAGIASSTRSAVRSKSSPAMAWRMASVRSPLCSYQSLARR